MSAGNGNGANRLLAIDGQPIGSERNAKDDHGRLLRHNATIREAHEIAIEEGNKVHSFYLDQIPAFVARMIQDALIGYGLIQLTDEAQGTLAKTEPPKSGADAGHSEGLPADGLGGVAPAADSAAAPSTSPSDAPPAPDAKGEPGSANSPTASDA